MGYRLPLTAVHGFTETANREMNVPAGFCIHQALKVEVSPSYSSEVECPNETHQGVDKQRAAPRPQVAVIITEAPFDRRHNTSVNDAGVRGCHLCSVDGFEVKTNFGHSLEQSGSTEKCPFGVQSCHILQPVRVADSVVCVDTEPDAGDNSCGHIHRCNCGETCHILSRCAKTFFVATEKDVRPTIDEYNRV